MKTTVFPKEMDIVPSLICMDLCNLERDVHRLEAMGCSILHVDILDGRYSPCMPIGLDTIRQLRERTQMLFDVHIMSVANEFFVSEALSMGVERVCFQLVHCCTGFAPQAARRESRWRLPRLFPRWTI